MCFGLRVCSVANLPPGGGQRVRSIKHCELLRNNASCVLAPSATLIGKRSRGSQRVLSFGHELSPAGILSEFQ